MFGWKSQMSNENDEFISSPINHPITYSELTSGI